MEAQVGSGPVGQGDFRRGRAAIIALALAVVSASQGACTGQTACDFGCEAYYDACLKRHPNDTIECFSYELQCETQCSQEDDSDP